MGKPNATPSQIEEQQLDDPIEDAEEPEEIAVTEIPANQTPLKSALSIPSLTSEPVRGTSQAEMFNHRK